ncbi:MAG: MBL fold metallo-hydrolase [Campylobacterota bacterium]|nr:MBL fold metallo-hydrolase [Campylobacterota bacterium]
MKKIILVTLVLISLFASSYNLKPIKITKDITCVIGDFNPPMKSNKGFVSNMCYINIGDSLVVLDAGPTYIFAKEFHSLMKKEYSSKKISHVVLSNFHDDRIQGASYFKDLGVKIVGHSTINEDIKQNPNKFQRMEMILDPKDLKGTTLIQADTLVDSGYKIKGTQKTLEIIKPSEVSEEKSDIAIYSKDDSFLFVGNIVFNGRMLNYTKNSNVDKWIEAIENLAALDAKYLLGGHGGEYDKNSYIPSLEYLKILKHDVKKAYDKEIDVEDIQKHFRDGKFKNIPYYKQLNYNNISIYYDQLEWAE